MWWSVVTSHDQRVIPSSLRGKWRRTRMLKESIQLVLWLRTKRTQTQQGGRGSTEAETDWHKRSAALEKRCEYQRHHPIDCGCFLPCLLRISLWKLYCSEIVLYHQAKPMTCRFTELDTLHIFIVNVCKRSGWFTRWFCDHNFNNVKIKATGISRGRMSL